VDALWPGCRQRGPPCRMAWCFHWAWLAWNQQASVIPAADYMRIDRLEGMAESLGEVALRHPPHSGVRNSQEGGSSSLILRGMTGSAVSSRREGPRRNEEV
jgi:hypothetical protein